MSDDETLDDEDLQEWATYCPDCEAMYFSDEEGYEWEECIECGECNCFEVPAA